MTVRVGVVGTSWWADSMYLPALRAIDDVDVVAVAGRNPDRAAEFARTWEIETAHTDIDAFFATPMDAVVVASGNDSHHPITMQALDAGLDVLCEKPLGLTTVEADEMVEAAARAEAITLVPFTYLYMPHNRWVKRLVDEGYLGTPYHLGLRYFTGFARDGEYAWRFDRGEAGSGVIGDLGSHWLALARHLYGEIEAIGATSSSFIEREERPDGAAYERGEDSAVMTVRFASGAYGVLQVSAVCWEGTDFNQTHEFDAHGSDGTLYATCDWSTRQEVRGLPAGETGPAAVLPIPDTIWGDARRDRVHDTYRDTFRAGGAMIGDFIDAVRSREPTGPDFADGARVQRLCDAAVASADRDGAMITV